MVSKNVHKNPFRPQVSFCLWGSFWRASRVGAGGRETQPVEQRVGISAPTLTPRERGGAGGWDQALVESVLPWAEASTIAPQMGFRSSGWWQVEVQGRRGPLPTPMGSTLFISTLHHVLRNKQFACVHVSLSSVSCSDQWLEPKEGWWVCGWSARSTGDSPDLGLASEMGHLRGAVWSSPGRQC